MDVPKTKKSGVICPGLTFQQGSKVHWLSYLIVLLASFFLLFYYSYVHTTLGSFLHPAPTPSLTTHSVPSLSPPTPSIPDRNYFALISNFVEERV
jgi:hypothetical protein